MSRAYKVEVSVKGVAPKALSNLMTKRFGWDQGHLSEYRGMARFIGDGWLTGGQSEKEAHEQIYKALKAMNPKALISTQWTYLEEFPYSEYGDDFDADTPLEEVKHGE